MLKLLNGATLHQNFKQNPIEILDARDILLL